MIVSGVGAAARAARGRAVRARLGPLAVVLGAGGRSCRVGQRGERTGGDGLVPGARARPGDGHPADRPTAGRGACRAGAADAGPVARRPGRAAVPGRAVRARRPARAGAGRRPAAAAARRGPAAPRRRTAGRGRSAGYTWPARCWSCRSSRSPPSRWPTWSASGTGIRRSPGGGSSASRRPARWDGSWPACGRTGCAAGLRPMRQLAVLSAALMLLIALGALVHQGWIVVGFALGAVVTVADNGLAYVSVAELAGSAWSGRALGVQNTVQNVAAVATAPVLAAVIGDSRYALAFLRCCGLSRARDAADAGACRADAGLSSRVRVTAAVRGSRLRQPRRRRPSRPRCIPSGPAWASRGRARRSGRTSRGRPACTMSAGPYR